MAVSTWRSKTHCASQQDIELRELYDARARLVKAGALPGKKRSKFQEVKITQHPVSFMIHLPNGIRLEWPTDNTSQSLAGLHGIVEQLK
ncbi:MAG: hypothetical protein RPU52_10460 [Candidatus Sedimenticola sp. (ex Thyasira tokunagai)]